MARHLRLLWLISVARVRSLGPFLWCGVCAWMLWSVTQEPQLLRSHGIFLTEGAAWWGVAMLLLAWFAAASPRRGGLGAALLANWFALVGAAGLLTLILWLSDLATGAWHSVDPLANGGRFLFCASGPAAAFAACDEMTQPFYVSMFAFGLGVASIGLVAGPIDPATASAAGLLLLAGHGIAVSTYLRT
jgi:hypothetical protein